MTKQDVESAKDMPNDWAIRQELLSLDTERAYMSQDDRARRQALKERQLREWIRVYGSAE